MTALVRARAGWDMRNANAEGYLRHIWSDNVDKKGMHLDTLHSH